MSTVRSSMQKSNRDPVAAALGAIAGLIVGIFKGIFRGIVKLRTIPAWIVMAVTAGISLFAIRYRTIILQTESLFGRGVPMPVRYVFLILLAAAPVWYLLILGTVARKKAGRYDEVFADIAFLDKKKRYPLFMWQKKDGHKIIYCFRSNIPLSDWKKAKDRLETGFDCSIRHMDYDSNKKTVRIVTVPSDFQIPDMLPWNDGYITPVDAVLRIGESDISSVSFDLDRTPHVLVAGETGSGKSVVLRNMLWQMANKGCHIYMIDFKGGVEFGKQYECFGEVITERSRALAVLEMLVEENKVRLELFRDLEVKNLKEYNKKTGTNLCRIGVFCDEIAEMLDKKGVAKSEREIYEKLEGALSTLARLSRATGINLFLGVQRPDANVLTGQIKNNIPVRISGRFADKPASEIVLGSTDACDLPDVKGRFLYKMGNELIEFQGYYFDDERDLHEIDVSPGDMLIGTPAGKAQKVKGKIAIEGQKPGDGVTISVEPETEKRQEGGSTIGGGDIDLDLDYF